jgi:tetratricopeptide (TPR) repeat protein
MACSTGKQQATPQAYPEDVSLTTEELDHLWAARVDSQTAYQALAAYVELAEQSPASIPLWSGLAHAYYYCAHYFDLPTAVRDSLYLEGYEASQSILNRDDEYRSLLFSTGDERVAVQGVDVRLIDALYWGMANYAQWLVTKGELVQLGQRDLIQTTLEHIHDLDSTYYFGAYYRFMGAFLARDPAGASDTTAVRTAFEKALEIAPDYLGNYTLMAQHYCPQVGDKNLFYSLLTKVLTYTDSPDIPYYPENIHEKRLAEHLMMAAEKEDWFD